MDEFGNSTEGDRKLEIQLAFKKIIITYSNYIYIFLMTAVFFGEPTNERNTSILSTQLQINFTTCTICQPLPPSGSRSQADLTPL